MYMYKYKNKYKWLFKVMLNNLNICWILLYILMVRNSVDIVKSIIDSCIYVFFCIFFII